MGFHLMRYIVVVENTGVVKEPDILSVLTFFGLKGVDAVTYNRDHAKVEHLLFLSKDKFGDRSRSGDRLFLVVEIKPMPEKGGYSEHKSVLWAGCDPTMEELGRAITEFFPHGRVSEESLLCTEQTCIMTRNMIDAFGLR